MKAVIAPAYLPNIYYLSWLIHQKEIYFSADTHYQKQTFRNRCEICAANGKLKLTIPVTHQKKQRHQKENKVQIAYTTLWQKQHWKSLTTAYRSSPYFEFYETEISVFYQKRIASLMEFNLSFLEKIMELIEFPLEYTLVHWNQEHHYRMDHLIDAKNKLSLDFIPYHQVFQNKFNFIANLSILDVLFNLGPDTLSYLKKHDFLH